MSQIVFLAQDTDMFETACSVLKPQYSDIHIENSTLEQSASVIAQLAANGTEIIITRAAAAVAIKAANIKVTIVEISVSPFDTLRAIQKAKQHGSRIAIISYPSFLYGLDLLSSILEIDLRLYPIHTEADIELKAAQILQDGADVLVGGFIAKKIADQYKKPFEIARNGSDSILQAAKEAKRIAHARSLEKAKTSLFRAVLDYAYEGIISTDSEYRITSFNPFAERITGLSQVDVLGKRINEVWPELKLEEVIHTGRDDLGEILKINTTDVLCNKVAILVNHKPVGAVVTFQDITKIQQMENRIRQRIYATGHIANLTFQHIERTSASLEQTIYMAKQIALTRSSILITGETGTGKEVFAQSIHNYSDCCNGPFVAINCAALPAQILESELFGYERGAFTGADPKGKSGLFELAHNGTIFLDEIAEMEYITQGKLLRVLQERVVRRLGGDHIIPINVRIIAATNKNLKALVNQNKFRADLYYRLNVLQLRIPPLRERKKDIELLAGLFLKEQSIISKHNLKLTPAALKVLSDYSWPGNVRELKNVIERIIAVHKRELIDAQVVKLMLKDQHDSDFYIDSAADELAEIKEALKQARGNHTRAAKLLGISRSTLWRKLKHH